MTVFITNQKKLAMAISVTPQHLCACKRYKRPIGTKLASTIQNITGVNQTLWEDKTKAEELDIALKNFFKEQQEKEMKEFRFN